MKRHGFTALSAVFAIAVCAIVLFTIMMMIAIIIMVKQPEAAQPTIAGTASENDHESPALTSAIPSSMPDAGKLAEMAVQIQPILELDYSEESRRQLLNTVAQILAAYPPADKGYSTRVDIPISLPLEWEPNSLHSHINPWSTTEVLGAPYLGEGDIARYGDENEYFIVYLIIDPLPPSLVIGRSESLHYEPNPSAYASWMSGFAHQLPFLFPDSELMSQI